MKRNNRTKETGAEYLAFLMKGKKTIRKLCEAAGVSYRHNAAVRGWVDAYKAVGLVYIYEYTFRGEPVYAFQPALYEFPDAEAPACLKTA